VMACSITWWRVLFVIAIAGGFAAGSQYRAL